VLRVWCRGICLWRTVLVGILTQAREPERRCHSPPVVSLKAKHLVNSVCLTHAHVRLELQEGGNLSPSLVNPPERRKRVNDVNVIEMDRDRWIEEVTVQHP
jgi:hypothetical protein